MDIVICEKCGERVDASGFWQPLICVEREADAYGPPTYFMFGDDCLLHRCVFADVGNGG